MYKFKKIYLRNEINYNEKRTPIIPNDIIHLINNGYTVWIQSSVHRIYTDLEYENSGGIITNLPWYNEKFKDALIVGLKELDNLEKLNSHSHIYFSHTYKNQDNSKIILNNFKKTNSIILDFEYFINKDNKRIISFGFFAGINGCALGLLHFFSKLSNKQINNLIPWKNLNSLIDCIKLSINLPYTNLKIGIIGANGNTGQGVIYILDKFNLSYDSIYKNTPKNNLQKYDILFNCINLSVGYDEIWFDSNTKFNKNIIIVDISCDYNKPNNPIKIYNDKTTWKNPVVKYNNFVDIISIDNLPSLLPFDSSIYFSGIFINLLLNIEDYYWIDNLNKFLSITTNI